MVPSLASKPHKLLLLSMCPLCITCAALFAALFALSSIVHVGCSNSLDAAHPSPTPLVSRGLLVSDVFVDVNGFFYRNTSHDQAHALPVKIDGFPKDDFLEAQDMIYPGTLLALCGAFKWGHNWYHNLYDDFLPVVKLMEQHHLWNTTTPDQRVIVFLNQPSDKNNTAFNELLSLHFGTILLSEMHWHRWLAHTFGNVSNTQPLVQFARTLLVPTATLGSGHIARQGGHQFDAVDYDAALVLARVTEDALAAQGHSIPSTPSVDVQLVYRDVGARSFINLDDIVVSLQGYCKKRGLHCNASQANGGLVEQFDMFRNAKVVVAAHGASLSNVLWMHPNAAVVEVFPMGFENLLYQGIANHLGLRYFSIQANETHPSWIEYDWMYTRCKSVADCPQLGDFNYLQCLLTMDAQDKTCRKVLRQQRIKVDVNRLLSVLTDASNTTYVPKCHWQPRGHNMLVECS